MTIMPVNKCLNKYFVKILLIKLFLTLDDDSFGTLVAACDEEYPGRTAPR